MIYCFCTYIGAKTKTSLYTKEETILKKIALILAILTLFSCVSILLIFRTAQNGRYRRFFVDFMNLFHQKYE